MEEEALVESLIHQGKALDSKQSITNIIWQWNVGFATKESKRENKRQFTRRNLPANPSCLSYHPWLHKRL